MKFIQNFLSVYLAVSLFAIDGQTQEQIGVASAVNKNTTDLTLEQERKLIDAGYEIIQNHTIESRPCQHIPHLFLRACKCQRN